MNKYHKFIVYLSVKLDIQFHLEETILTKAIVQEFFEYPFKLSLIIACIYVTGQVIPKGWSG